MSDCNLECMLDKVTQVCDGCDRHIDEIRGAGLPLRRLESIEIAPELNDVVEEASG